MTLEEKERLKSHFKKEDASFLIRCMTNRYGDCSGCEYYSLCNEEIDNDRSQDKQNKKLSNTRLQKWK